MTDTARQRPTKQPAKRGGVTARRSDVATDDPALPARRRAPEDRPLRFARGEARADSDYDLLLVEPSEFLRHKRAARYRRALTGLACAKDILVWTPEEIAEWREVPNALVTEAVRKGIELYERPL